MNRGLARLELMCDPVAHLSGIVEHLRADGLVAYPTETVYGLGGRVSEPAVARLSALKARAEGKPFLILVESAEAVAGLQWTDSARELARIFWPGSLTLVLSDPLGIFPGGVRDAGTGAVAVRVSPHPLVARLVAALGGPLTSTSLNPPGEAPAASGTDALDVVRQLGSEHVLVLDGGTLPPSAPSTIVDCTGPEPVVRREGSVPTKRLQCVIPEIQVE
jgi:L-threonylcarbamoyladenylate synthase